MWFNYFKLTLRNLWKHRLYSFINITGLGLGIAFTILIFLFISDERSFDSFHQKLDRIYRVEEVRYEYGDIKSMFDLDGDGKTETAWLPTPLGPALQNEISGIVNFTRFGGGEAVFNYNGKIFQENITFVDPGFLNMFDFEVNPGSQTSALSQKHHIILTRELANRYFENEDPLGKNIELDIYGDKQEFTVTGIIQAPPANSSIHFQALVRQENRPYYEENMKSWQSFNTPLFIELYTATPPSIFNETLSPFVEKYFGEEIREMREKNNLEENIPVFQLSIKPLEAIHLDKNVSWAKVSDPMYSYILTSIGILILLIACINYISISLSTASGRSKEVGVRKVLGAGPMTLARQFWGESQILVIISVIFGIILANFLLAPFNEFTQKSMVLFKPGHEMFFVFLMAVCLTVGVLAGGYPAIFLARFKTVEVFKSRSSNKLNPIVTRIMVVIQYTLSGFLIVSSMIMFRQMEYVANKNLGYDMEQVMVIPTFTGYTDDGEKTVNQLRESCSNVPGILDVAGTSASFNRGWSRNGFEIEGQNHAAFTYRVNETYTNVLGLEILSGRNFDFNRPSDTRNAIIVNEALVAEMGWQNPLGEKLFWRQDSAAAEVIGVVKNYHFLSLESTIDPLILYINPGVGKITTALIKIKADEIPETIQSIEKEWKSLYPDKPFEFSFLDADVANQYQNYSRWMKIMTISTLLAIFISCLGLFGLAGINALNRTKEISIRKVLGASFTQLIYLLNKEVTAISLVSFLIASPIAYFVMSKWLESFTFRTEINGFLFLAALVAGMLIAILTVGFHSYRTARSNPAAILKDE